MTHLVNRLQFEVTCSEEQQAINLRYIFAQTFQKQIEGVIEKVCNQYVPENESLRIDKLEIDMGHLTMQSIDKEFEFIFLHKFQQQLTEKLIAIPANKRAASIQHSNLELLQFFLQTGNLSWWSNELTIDFNEITSNVLNHQQNAIKVFLWENRNRPIIWQRIGLQLNYGLQQSFIALFDELKEAINVLNELTSQIKTQHQLLSWEIVTDDLNIIEQNQQALHTLIITNAPLFFNINNNNTQLLKSELLKIIADHFRTNNKVLQGLKMIITKLPDWVPIVDLIEAPINTFNKPIDFTGNATLNKFIASTDIEQEFNEKRIVRHAGIVLVAPFLIPFFTAVNLLEDKNWKSAEAQLRAVCLLKHLATGDNQFFEYQLHLEKLLCGIPLQQTLSGEIVLSEIEIQETNALLQSIIEHWKALKNTSINGLRETFFKRDGILQFKGDSWLLQVERKTVDVLLDSIPWGYSTIRLPWNNYTLETAW